ncbi:MAG: glycosyltransferase family 4 protein [archaeon]
MAGKTKAKGAKTEKRQQGGRHLRVGFIHPKLTFEGGADRQILQLAKNLHDRGHECVVFTRQFKRESCFPQLTKDLDMRSLELPLGRRGPFPEFFLKHTLDICRMRHMVRKAGRFDALFVQDDPSHWVGVLGARKDTALLWMCNDPPHWFTWKEIKKTSTSYGEGGGKYAKGPFALFRAISNWKLRSFDWLLSRRIDKVAVLDTKNQRMVKEFYGKKAEIVRSGIQVGQFKNRDGTGVRKKLGIGQTERMLLCVGLFMPHRRYEDVVSALGNLDDKRTRLVIVGDSHLNPAYFQHIKQLVKKEGLEKQVSFAGYVPDDELPDYYAAADVFIFPNDQQTWGLAVLEALASGTPAIVSKGTGVKEVLDDGKTAVLYTPGDVAKLTSHIKRLTTDKTMHDRLAKAGKDFVNAKITDRTYADRIETILLNLASERRKK